MARLDRHQYDDVSVMVSTFRVTRKGKWYGNHPARANAPGRGRSRREPENSASAARRDADLEPWRLARAERQVLRAMLAPIGYSSNWNRTLHRLPAGSLPSGFGTSRRTPNVPLAASTI